MDGALKMLLQNFTMNANFLTRKLLFTTNGGRLFLSWVESTFKNERHYELVG